MSTMGPGFDTDISYGLVGIGYAPNGVVAAGPNSVRPNLLVMMVSEGLINTIACSLWLNDLGKTIGWPSKQVGMPMLKPF